MNDLEKLKNHFEGFKNLEFINSESVQSRIDAFERFCQKGVPSLKQEHWKYSPLSKDLIHFQNLKFSLNQNKSFNDTHFEKFDHYRVLLKDGVLISDDIKEEGLEITKYKQDQFYEIEKNQILDFNNAFFTPGFEIRVDSNVNIKKPIVIYNYFSKDFDGNNINNKNYIYLDKNSKAEIYEKNIFEDEKDLFFTKNLDIELEQDANLVKYYLNSTNNNKTIYNFIRSKLKQNSEFEKFNFSHNVSSCRDEIIADLNGTNAFVSLNNIQHLSQKCFHEIKWEINHNEENTRSSQFVKSALHDDSVAAFQGKIFVDSKAQKTDGYQLSRALLLSDRSKFLSKPELEIYADDVKCSHGSSSGSIDQESIFYLRSRGINEPQAKCMMIEGFLAEVINKVKNEDVRNIFYNKLNEINNT
ncbi:ABC-type transport system involved in Fe-S cluster assembly, permease protein [alpha proteobacterium HIMB114]|nr:ABC-type transport system involved in Fe-S cluster assembly, permease protein [alpha proteobacterium HIMB114]